MKQIKFFTKQAIQFLLSIFIFITLISIFQYVQLLNQNTISILSIAFLLILSFILGVFSGKNAETKGYIEGLKLGGILIFLLLLLNLIFFQSKFTIQRIIYYIVLILCTTIGAMIGISKKMK